MTLPGFSLTSGMLLSGGLLNTTLREAETNTPLKQLVCPPPSYCQSPRSYHLLPSLVKWPHCCCFFYDPSHATKLLNHSLIQVFYPDFCCHFIDVSNFHLEFQYQNTPTQTFRTLQNHPWVFIHQKFGITVWSRLRR